MAAVRALEGKQWILEYGEGIDLSDRQVHGAFEFVGRINPSDLLLDAADAVQRFVEQVMHGQVPACIHVEDRRHTFC